MRLFLLISFTVLLISVSRAKKDATVHSKISPNLRCKNKNPFLSRLQSNGVRIFDQVVFGSKDKCGKEWEEYGTCCDIETLKEYASKDIMAIKTATESIKSKMEKIDLGIGRLLKEESY